MATIYDLSPHGYYARGLAALKRADAGDRCSLFYAAVEFRCSIEQLTRSFLRFLGANPSEGDIRALFHAESLSGAILASDPDFYKKLQFIGLLSDAVGLGHVYGLDLDELERVYNELTPLVHLQGEPEQSVDRKEWWIEIRARLAEAQTILAAVLKHEPRNLSINPEKWTVFQEWKHGQSDAAEVIHDVRMRLGL
jgi:hypothetical protein